MSERPKDGVDPDATVMIPAARADDDATVMMPAARPDDDATVMMPAARADDDATVMMPAEDPEATIAIPTPGRRRDNVPVELPSAPPAGRGRASAADLGALGGLNALVAAANPVLAVVAQIRHALRHPDPEGLRAGLRGSLDAFERAARAAGASDEALANASLALCALLDESAASTPWGRSWSSAGLLAERHPGSNGGEKFFAILDNLSGDAAANLVQLEFFFVCLALGFEGRYRDAAQGREDLAALRAGLLDRIRQQRAPDDGELSARWRGVSRPARRPSGGLALWAAGSGAALLLAALYIVFSSTLGSNPDPVARDLAQLKVVAPAVAVAPGKSDVAPSPGISEHLSADIGRGEIAVTDAAGTSTIVIRSDRLFASGSARLEAEVEPAILRIAEALDRVPGAILVTGHTDDVPIRTARFPSNWELSTARATSVVALIAGKLRDPTRLRAEGLADSAPAAPNDSAANRARNRRVTLILRSGP